MQVKYILPESEAINELVKEYPEYFSLKSGRFVKLTQWDEEGFELVNFGKGVVINYRTKSDMFRALLTLIVENKKKRLYVRQKPPLDFRGLMIDCSRNAVVKEEYLKKIIIQLALLGYNYLTLYTEDTYEVKEEPLIGYLRGKYTIEELKRISKYAQSFGIEMFPCIQTLGHSLQILKFSHFNDVKDTDYVFSTESRCALKLIETMIKNAVEPYDSKLIHVGLDEALGQGGVGTGKTFKYNTKMDPRAMFLKHVQNVNAICKKLKLKPIMWGDIVLGKSHAKAMTAKQTKALPKNIIMNYWDYYKEDKKIYEVSIKAYRKIGFEPLVSPAMWSWNMMWALYRKVEMSAPFLLEAAKKMKIKRAMMTLWGDDGSECPFGCNLPGLVLYAEHCYVNKVKNHKINNIVHILGRDKLDSFVLPSELDLYKKKLAKYTPNISKSFIFDDPLIGIFASHALGKKLNPFYRKIFKKIEKVERDSDKGNKLLFDYAKTLAEALSVKADLRNETYLAYNAKNKEKLKKILKDIPIVSKKVQTLWDAHRKIWLYERKPLGLEVLDVRYSGVIGRLKVMQERLSGYINGKIENIPELEEKPQKIFNDFDKSHLMYGNIDTISMIK